MRANKFESAGVEPLAEGSEKKVFINPKNERRVISERKDGVAKDTHRQLKGRYYLTKIAHALLPNRIPEIYQAGESVDGKQTVDTEAIAGQVEGSSAGELVREYTNNPGIAREVERVHPGIKKVDVSLEQMGFGASIDFNAVSYAEDRAGNTRYLETFKPWQADVVDPKELRMLFDEETIRENIKEISDQQRREKCERDLERLLVLLEEEKKDTKELEKNRVESLLDCRPIIEKLESEFNVVLTEDNLIYLNSIKTLAEALSDEGRAMAKGVRTVAFNRLKFLQEKTNITSEEYNRLYERYRILDRAVGTVNSGLVDHDR